MSGIDVKADFAGLAAMLTRAARDLAASHGATARLARTAPLRVWREARLLWPLFTKGTG